MAKNGARLTAKLSKSLVDKEPRSARSLIPKEENNMPYLTFSFRYCTQQEYFGVKGEDAAWFANLQERLKDLSGKTGAILESKIERETYRLHPINWNARNCPIKKEDLLSVPNNIRDNKEEDFFWQFQLSKGTGRVVGFFNEMNSIFYIVLLDPKHNIQPSKKIGYAVDDTEIAITEFERLEMKLANAGTSISRCKHNDDCPVTDICEEYNNSNMFFVELDKELREVYEKIATEGDICQEFEDFLMDKYFKE